MDYLRFLEERDLDLAIFKDGELVFSSAQEGLSPLVRAIEEVGLERLRGCVVADRVIGRAAALLICLMGAREAHALVMSKGALRALEGHGIIAQARDLVEHITAPDGKSPCLFERLVKDVEEPEEAYRLIVRRLRELRKPSEKSREQQA